ncbi:MAG: hypothetical protein RLZZ387_2598 [Chloroflexota bacterium]
MTELVEKVARAIVIAMHKDLYGADAIPVEDNEWLNYTPEATAAIEAMRPEIEREEREAVLAFMQAHPEMKAHVMQVFIRNGEHRSKP